MQETRKNLFAEMEAEVLAFWEQNKIFNKSVERDAPRGDYVFYDGPPFATGTPHYGHIVASLMKDVVPRYWTMQGFRVERRWGWDCHGLPIENIVEKEMGTRSKKDIIDMGVDKFNDFCRTKVMKFADDWKEVVRKLGRWVDMENAYRTMDRDYMESIWWVFRELWDRGYIYKDYKSMHICPRCETTLSQQEVTEGYADIKDLSCVAKFELENPTNLRIRYEFTNTDKVYILAWTTTPWTLIGNVALAVGKEIGYVAVEVLNEGFLFSDEKGFNKERKNIYVICSREFYDRFQENKGKSLGKVKTEFIGKHLIGAKYKPLFNYWEQGMIGCNPIENMDNGWKVVAADFVTTDDGTGVVHIAPAFGEDDMNLGRSEKLPFIQHVKMNGAFIDEVRDFAGMNVKPIDDPSAGSGQGHMSTDVEIIKYLAHYDSLFSKEKYEHSYPHCWRCDTPLLNYATSSWFVAISKMKKELLENAKAINWIPAHVKEGSFGNWLEGAHDWSISRQRFWATGIPIWECECGNRQVIGSVAELENLSGQKFDDIHKDKIDVVIFKCPHCGKEMRRTPDVFDCWFESGSMPYAQMHYPFENKEKFEANFPAQFIAEGSDQTRAWFYYLHAIATGVRDRHAFNNVIVNGIVVAEDGKKMSKKLQNYPDPTAVIDKYSADALRYYLFTSPVMLAENLNFSEKGVQESLRKTSMLLWNVYKFYSMFNSPLGRGGTNEVSDGVGGGVESENILDQWIIVRLDQLISEITDNMNAYNLPKATRPIADFIDDLSTWYLRRSRDRFKGADEDDKQAALRTTQFVLIELSKLLAPFMPFIAEELWQKVSGNNFANEDKSVHLESWPTLSFRPESRPAGEESVGGVNEKTDRRQQATKSDVINEMQKVRKIVELALAKRDEIKIKVRQALAELRIANCELRNEYKNLIMDEVNVKEIVCKKGDGELSVELDTALTPELIQEGIARELVRTINGMRKKAGLTIEDRISIVYSTGDVDISTAIEKFGVEITRDTLADSIQSGDTGDMEEIKVNNGNIKLKISH